MADGERLETVVRQLRQMSRFVEEHYRSDFDYRDRGQLALDQLRSDLPFLIDFATGGLEEEPAVGYRKRTDGMMIELQRIPDDRPMSGRVLTGPDLQRLGEQDEALWRAVWERLRYSPHQIQLLGSAFGDLESAWLVFWESRDPERALWRLIDAAGQLAEVFAAERQESTGRGYRVEKVPPFCDKGHRWDDTLSPRLPAPPAPASSRQRIAKRAPAGLKTKPVSLDPRRAFSRLQKAEIFLRCNGCCVACGVEVGDDWHADHIYPHAWGGVTEVINGQVLCQSCNARKRDNVVTADE